MKIFIRAPPTNVCEALLFSACPSICLSVRGHSNLVVFNRISSKFHIWIASTNLSFKFEYRFCPTSDSQDGRQNGCNLSISAVMVTLTQSFLIRFLPNFIHGLHPSSSHSSLNTGFVLQAVEDFIRAPFVGGALLFSACLSVRLSVVTLTQSF